MSKSLREQLAERRQQLQTAEDTGTSAPDMEELENAEEVEIDAETPEIEETSTPELPEEAEVTPESTEPVVTADPESAPAVAAGEAFVPEFKYRANGQDMEVPEYLRSLIKDKDSQEKVVTMLSKAEGFDSVSARRDQFRTERDSARGESQRYLGAIRNMQNTRDRGDIDGLLKLMELPEETVLKWATERAKYYMGDENYRRQVDEQNRMRQDSWQKEDRATDYQTKYQDLEAKQLQMEFNYEMLKPEVSSFETAFDKMAGKQGAFKEEVKNRGELAYLREQKTIAPGEVIQAIMKQFGPIAQAAPKPQPAQASAQAAKVVVKTAPKVATIPTVKGTQASPTKEGFTSMDAIRKYRKDTYGK